MGLVSLLVGCGDGEFCCGNFLFVIFLEDVVVLFIFSSSGSGAIDSDGDEERQGEERASEIERKGMAMGLGFLFPASPHFRFNHLLLAGTHPVTPKYYIYIYIYIILKVYF